MKDYTFCLTPCLCFLFTLFSYLTSLDLPTKIMEDQVLNGLYTGAVAGLSFDLLRAAYWNAIVRAKR